MAFILVYSVSWWHHQMGTLSALLALCAGNSPVSRAFPHIGQWRGALTFYLISAWINGWVNKREAADLRRHRAHYDAPVASEFPSQRPLTRKMFPIDDVIMSPFVIFSKMGWWSGRYQTRYAKCVQIADKIVILICPISFSPCPINILM